MLGHFRKAEDQLRDTDDWLPCPHPSRVRAVFVLNSGDYNLPTDFLAGIIERKVKVEWRMTKFRHLDLTMCASHGHGPGHPLHSHRLARSLTNPHVVKTAWHLQDEWIRYCGSELGLKVDFIPAEKGVSAPEYKEMAKPYAGKIWFRPAA